MNVPSYHCTCGQRVPLVRKPAHDEDFRPAAELPLVVAEHKTKMMIGAPKCSESGKEIPTPTIGVESAG